MNYRFCGRLTTGATLELADGSRREVLLFPGHTCDLPEEHAWVKRMVKRGYLVPAPGHLAEKKTVKAMMPVAEKEKA